MDVACKHILIIKPSSLGDIIHALPTLAAIRKKFPDSWITWVVKREFTEVLHNHPMLNEVLALDPGIIGWWILAKKLRTRGFDIAIDLQGLFRSACLAWCSGASERVGFAAAREGGAWFYTSRVRIPEDDRKPWRQLDVHAVDRNLTIAKHLGADIEVINFSLPPWNNNQQTIATLLKTVGIVQEDRLVLIAPGGRLPIKRWPAERYAEVAQSLIKMAEVKIVIVGTLSDLESSRPIQRLLGDEGINLMGKTRIGELMALIARADLLIANDSAPIHIAVACQTPVLAILGPTNMRATGPYPFGRERVLARSLPCSPCGKRQCDNPQFMECLTSISVEEVAATAHGMLKER